MSSKYIELDEIIKRHAFKLLRTRMNWFRRFFLDEDDFDCDIDWTYLTISHNLVKFDPAQSDGSVIETKWGNVTTGTKWVPLWSCDFDNKADGKQSHTFRGSRDTTTWVDVDLDQYYTFKREVEIEVNLPPHFTKVRAGRDNCLMVNKVKGQIFKELLTWEVNSQVEVVPGWKAHAQLLAKEESYSIDFEIRSTIYNPKGVLPVAFKRKSDGKVVFMVNISDYQEAFKSEEDGGSLTDTERPFIEVLSQQKIDKDGTETSESFPQVITKGSFVCLSWSDQKVDIKTSPLSLDESSYDGGDRSSSTDHHDHRTGNNLTSISNVTDKKVVFKRTIAY